MCLSFWKLATSYVQSGSEIPTNCDSLDLENIITKYFALTFEYLFIAIKETTTKTDMVSSKYIQFNY